MRSASGSSAHHGDNHAPLVARHFRKDRAAMLTMVGALELKATSADASVLQALDFVREYTSLTRDHISDQVVVYGEDGLSAVDDAGRPVTKVLDVSFASEDWRRAIRDRKHPGMFVRRHLEACVLSYLAEELRTGDIAVVGAQAYADWAEQLLSPAERAALLPRSAPRAVSRPTDRRSAPISRPGCVTPEPAMTRGIRTTRTWSSRTTGCRA